MLTAAEVKENLEAMCRANRITLVPAGHSPGGNVSGGVGEREKAHPWSSILSGINCAEAFATFMSTFNPDSFRCRGPISRKSAPVPALPFPARFSLAAGTFFHKMPHRFGRAERWLANGAPLNPHESV